MQNDCDILLVDSRNSPDVENNETRSLIEVEDRTSTFEQMNNEVGIFSFLCHVTSYRDSFILGENPICISAL